MAAASTPTTTTTSLKHYWRKIQGGLVDYAANFGDRYEYRFFKSCGSPDFPWSGYEATWTANLKEPVGIAMVPDSGLMAEPSSEDSVEMTATAVHFNGRFTYSNWAKFGARGDRNQIVAQLTAQSTQKLAAMTEEIGDKCWGGSGAIVALTDTDISGTTATLVLKNAWNQSAFNNPYYLAMSFPIGTRIVLADGSNVLIANSFGVVTARNPGTGAITVTFDGSVSTSTDNLRIYKAFSIERTTLAGGSDMNKGMVGFTEAYLSTSVNGVSSSSEPYWKAAYEMTAAGRFTVTKLLAMRQAIMNGSKLKMNALHIAQGVKRDMVKNLLGGARFEDVMGMKFDGNVKTTERMYSDEGRRIPPGSVWGMNTKCVALWDILALKGDEALNDLLPYTDYAADLGRTDAFLNLIWSSRQALGYALNQAESN